MLNIMNPPADWSTLKKLIWLRGTPITGGEELTVSGTPPLSLPNSLGKPLKAWEVDLLPKQDLHGYDSPWPAGGGKNLAIKKIDNATIDSGGKIVADNSFDVVVAKVESGTEYIYSENGVRVGLNACAYYDSEPSMGSVAYNSARVLGLTNPFTAQYSGYIAVRISSGSTKNQIEKGSTATAYAPYENLCPIHGTDKVTITTAGKNLYNSATFQTITRSGVTCTNNGDGSFTLNGTATNDVFFNVFSPQFAPEVGGTPLPSANYYLTGCPSGGGGNTYFLYITPNYRSDYGSGVSFTEPVNGGSIFVKNGYTCDNVVFRPQICLASAPNPTEFAPYLAPSQTAIDVLAVAGTVYGGTLTVNNDGSCSLVVDKVKVAKTWGEFTSKQTTTDYQEGRITQLPINISKRTETICEKLDYTTSFGVNTFYVSTAGYIRAAVPLSTTDSEVFTFVYPLDTPITYTLTSPTIPTPSGTATTWATAEDGIVDGMEVTYVGKA